MRPALAVTLLFAAALAPVGAAEDRPFTIAPHGSDDDVTPHLFTHRAMGTEFEFTIYPRPGDVGRDDLAPIVEEAFLEIDRMESEISSWVKTSNTSKINREATESPVEARPFVWELLEFSTQVAADTDGAFDITVGPLIDVWRSARENETAPDPDAVAAARAKVGVEKLSLDPESRTVKFATPGMRIDFGGIGKGLALDRAAEVLADYGVTSAILSGGNSSILAMGSPPGREYWRIGLHNPYNLEDRLDWVNIKDESLSTSGCYPESAETGEDRACGIFDPRTGLEVSDMLSVTVVAPTGIQTDALSTACFVLGIEGIRRYCANHPDVRVVAVQPSAGGAPSPVRIGHFD